MDALSGLRVLDLSEFLAAPQVSALLGDFGADVVKVEPPGGDPMRRMGVHRRGRSLAWALVSRNKRSVVVDTRTPEGTSRLKRLTAAADVVVTNQPRGVLATWGCTPEQILTRNERTVVVTVSCYGSSGPYAERHGTGSMAEAFGGLTFLTGSPQGPPTLPSVPLTDTLVAVFGALGALVACYHRDARGGRGQHVDVSMFEPLLTLLGPALVGWRPGEPPPQRTGSRLAGGGVHNVYATVDGRWVVISASSDDQVTRVLRLVGRDTRAGSVLADRSADPVRFANELDGFVAQWVARHLREDVVPWLQRLHVPVAPVNDLAEVAADPHVQERASVLHLADSAIGELTLPAPTPHLSATPGAVRTLGPALGAEDDSVLRDWLGE